MPPDIRLPHTGTTPGTSPAGLPTRLYLLDLLRGLAAVVVVVWHYQHFYYIAPERLPLDFARSVQPFYEWLSIFYHYGYHAVRLFFSLSGFVFFFQYAEKIRARKVSDREFFLLRFSRLYPLHLATLLLVALGQIVSSRVLGESIVYPCNDVRHFVLNLLFMTDWMPKQVTCLSFNSPIASVSVEVFLYAVFFGFALLLPKRFAGQLLCTLAVIGFSVTLYLLNGYHLFGEPVFCFFSGGLACLLWRRMHESGWSRRWTMGLTLVLAAASVRWIAVNGANNAVLGTLVYPPVIFLLAQIQSLHHNLGQKVRLLGDITYSTYLVHFPLQLTIMLVARGNGYDVDYSNPGIFLLFFLALFLISVPVYHYFEMPAQRALRRWMLPERTSEFRVNVQEA